MFIAFSAAISGVATVCLKLELKMNGTLQPLQSVLHVASYDVAVSSRETFIASASTACSSRSKSAIVFILSIKY